uniref:Uncharacterized protein n=1 Tax=Petalonia fascia TaxID=2893 RepID=A0A089PB07_PETFA|nr:hypothetical protein PefaMp22 [Petalonia fascia]AIQ78507.1 hypothetical protein PefaMp22 [Petalonia fascia]
MKNKEFSKNNLSKFYYSSLLFKKYCKYGLWFGSLEEFNNIRYCEKYLQKKIYFSIKNNLFRNLEPSSYLSPLINYNIIKFLDSRFLRYISFHFLLSFYNNSFLFPFVKSKTKIETFVNNYYQAYLQDKLEKDFLDCLAKSTNNFLFNFTEIVLPNSFFYVSIKISNSCNKNNSVKLYTKKKDIQKLFDSINSVDFFVSLKEKKKSIGIHHTVNIVFEINSNQRLKKKELKKFRKFSNFFSLLSFQNGNRSLL